MDENNLWMNKESRALNVKHGLVFNLMLERRRLCFCGSLLSRSLSTFSLSLGGSLGLSLGSSLSSLLVGYLLGDCLVNLLLGLELLSGSFLLGLGLALANSLCTLNLVGLPCVELLLHGSLVECALLDTTTKVFHHIDALTAEDVTHCV